jgi:major membrane immunogen (membrane-anchored lipoprotein)
MNITKKIIFGVFIVCVMVLPVSCGKTAYKDGVYSGKSSPDDTGAYGEVTVTVSGGKIAGCRFVTWQKDGAVKDENYGKVNGEVSNADYYNKAQRAVRAMAQYARDFAEKGALSAVDAVSGATVAYNQFTEAVDNALAASK